MTCYVDNIRKIYKAVNGVLEHNTDLLRNATLSTKVQLLKDEFQRFRSTEAKRELRTGQPAQLYYRLHWSGDVFNPEYAEALHQAIAANPAITFWGYTRSWFAVPALSHLPNLTLYLSLDPVNMVEGLDVYHANGGDKNPNLQICYMSPENDFQLKLPKAQIVLRECPVDVGRLPGTGGCSKCTRCISKGNHHVWFKT